MKSILERAIREQCRTGAGVLLALACASGAHAATASATATAVVLQPMTISKTADMTFGNLVAGNGTVTMSTTGVRSASGSTPLPNGVTPAPAYFTIAGSANNTFSISTTGSSTTLADSGTDTMPVAWFWEVTSTAAGTNQTSGTPATGTLSSGAAYIFVGAAVTVGATQAAATYTGTFQVSVDYN
ncbi:MAG: DUF4402 domain-containing protein [Pelomonas sp.]|nr:DUF4402 domain-containing protein [Roseateles sp.]